MKRTHPAVDQHRLAVDEPVGDEEESERAHVARGAGAGARVRGDGGGVGTYARVAACVRGHREGRGEAGGEGRDAECVFRLGGHLSTLGGISGASGMCETVRGGTDLGGEEACGRVGSADKMLLGGAKYQAQCR